ncbi:hypothetical protein HYX05_04075 [Candidatus Woesearchaeota archaeon]|nr:hypothetical protein [Candidatus Woesearchaeota archaeon]
MRKNTGKSLNEKGFLALIQKCKIAPDLKNIKHIFIIFALCLFLLTFVFADGWTASQPSHATLYTDTITSKDPGSTVNIADTQGLFVTGDITTIGRVGIGTTNPGGHLHLSASEPLFRIQATRADDPRSYSISNEYIDTTQGQSLLFRDSTSGTIPMMISNDGNVGIGTTSPVATNGAWTPIVQLVGSVPSFSLSRNTGANQRMWDIAVGTGGLLQFFDDTGNANRMVIDTNGNVGIGTMIPSNKLQVNGRAGFIASSAGAAPIWGYASDGTTANVKIGSISSDNSGIQMFLADGTTENVRIHTNGDSWFNGGNVGIGTASPGTNLHIATNGATRLRLTTDPAFYNWQIAIQDHTSGALEFTPSTAVGGSTFSTPAVTILNTGNVGIGTASPGAKLVVASGGNTATSYTESSYRSNWGNQWST